MEENAVAPTATVRMKRCPKCGEEKAMTGEFWLKHKECRGGLQTNRCKTCESERAAKRYQEHQEIVKQSRQSYYKANPKRSMDCTIKWTKKHPDQVKQFHKKSEKLTAERLSDGYIRKQLRKKGIDDLIPEIMALKRGSILMQRNLRKLKEALSVY